MNKEAIDEKRTEIEKAAVEKMIAIPIMSIEDIQIWTIEQKVDLILTILGEQT